MQTNGFRIIKATQSVSSYSSGYDHTHEYMYGYELDLSRKTAALMRQSRRGGDASNPESRLRQEGLMRVAVEIRADHDPLMVIPCDEGSGVSGQKKIYERPKFLELWKAIQDGTVGSIIVAREDRLFRDRFLTQATQFAETCAKRGVILIVAGRRAYDFRIQDDFNAFIRKMQEAYGYIDTHIRYMHAMKLQKLARGEWVGGGLPTPYVMDRAAIQLAREHRKIIKEFGATEEDELLIAKAFRPIIYEPWHPVAVDLFKKFKLFDFSQSRLGRYIEDKPYLFPLPTVADQQAYLFRTHMKLVPSLGYTFANTKILPKWMCNPMLIGFAGAGKDEDGKQIYIEEAFDAAIDRGMFEECYEALTGHTLDGKPGRYEINHSRFSRQHLHANALLTRCLKAPENISVYYTARAFPNRNTYYIARTRPMTAGGGTVMSLWDEHSIWNLPVVPFDRSVVTRLGELAEYDKELAKRVEQYYNELTETKASEKQSILQDIAKLEALVARYDHLLTNPAQPLTTAQEKRYLKSQADAERELEKAQIALHRYEQTEPIQLIPAFYRILGDAPAEFWKLGVDRQRKMLRLLIECIEVDNISPHLYSLHLKWKDPVAQPWDCALIYRRRAFRSRTKDGWSDDESQLLQQIYANVDKVELHKAFPMRSAHVIRQRASELGIKRGGHGQQSELNWVIHPSLCYADWTNTCQILKVDHESEEGAAILRQLNHFAKTTPLNSTTFWWLLPVVEISNFEEGLSR